MGAKTRWILQGFHDPDIEMLNRSVSTPETEDVPLALQLIASIRARAFTSDVRAAFTQRIRDSAKNICMPHRRQVAYQEKLIRALS